MKWFALSTLLCLHTQCLPAQNGVMILKKANGRQIDKYFKGKQMDFFTKEGMPVTGAVQSITSDSVHLVYHIVQKRMTPLGISISDTTATYLLAFSIDNIGAFPANRRGKLLPSAMLLGGLGYTVVNVFNTVREGDAPFAKDNIGNVFWGLGSATAGYAWLRLKSKKYVVGKKYKLAVIE
jgi:hypothetical protein